MLGRKKRKQAVVRTLVGSDTKVHGDVEFTGGFHVDGYVRGNVEAVQDGDSVLSISEQGCVEGSVVVPHLILNGTVKGDVRATERVELGPRARVIGNVQYKLIEMAIGAEVNGKLIHDGEGSAARPQSGGAQIKPVSTVKIIGEQDDDRATMGG